MNRHRRKEAKRARRRARLAAETPEQRERREARRAAQVDVGSKRLASALNFPKGHGAAKRKSPKRFKVVPCACPRSPHGIHEVRDYERERQEEQARIDLREAA